MIFRIKANEDATYSVQRRSLGLFWTTVYGYTENSHPFLNARGYLGYSPESKPLKFGSSAEASSYISIQRS